jgi:hypothetical protein
MDTFKVPLSISIPFTDSIASFFTGEIQSPPIDLFATSFQPKRCFSKYGCQPMSLSLHRILVKNANSEASPQTFLIRFQEVESATYDSTAPPGEC